MSDVPVDNNFSDTNDGFIVGTDPKEQPRMAVDWSAQETEVSRSQQPVTISEPMPQQPGSNFFTAEDIERVRREEKDKLYSKINSMESQLGELRTERESRLAAEEAVRQAAEDERRAVEEEKMSAKQLIERTREEYDARINELQQNYDRDRALFEQERRLMEVDQYRQARLEQDAEYIMPELRDLVRGNNEDEIETAIEEMKIRTAAIMQNVNSAVVEQRQMQRGVAPTAPPVGPLEQASTYESLSPDDIRGMDMETYRKYRERLIPAASQAYRRGGR